MTLLTRRGPGRSGLHTWSSGAPNFTLGGKGSWFTLFQSPYMQLKTICFSRHTYNLKLFFAMIIKSSFQVCQHRDAYDSECCFCLCSVFCCLSLLASNKHQTSLIIIEPLKLANIWPHDVLSCSWRCIFFCQEYQHYQDYQTYLSSLPTQGRI